MRVRLDLHLVLICLSFTIAGVSAFATRVSVVIAIVLAQVPLLVRTLSPRFRGWDYVIWNELAYAIIGAIAATAIPLIS